MSEQSTTVITIPRRWIVGIRLGGAVIGLAAAFIIGPVVSWLLGLAGDAPGPLRLAAGLPLVWAIPVLTAVGLVVGFGISRSWQQETGTTTITDSGVTVEQGGSGRHIPRERIAGVFTDDSELVLVDCHSAELLRAKSDKILVGILRDALTRYGYPWQGSSDPYGAEFLTWVDGSGPVETRGHDLLRTRERALADKRGGSAADARDALGALGVVVRDRGGKQQYRLILR